MAANSPIMREVVARLKRALPFWVFVMAFVLTECALPGVLMQNKGLNFVCRDTRLRHK